MELIINGETIEYPGNRDVGSLIDFYGQERTAVVVEVNNQIPNRTDWDRWALTPGDRIEIVRFIGGG